MRPASRIDEILKYWFEELTLDDWFKVDAARDAEIERRFRKVYDELAAGVPASWLIGPDGFLAAILVLDQFPGNASLLRHRCGRARARQARYRRRQGHAGSDRATRLHLYAVSARRE